MVSLPFTSYLLSLFTKNLPVSSFEIVVLGDNIVLIGNRLDFKTLEVAFLTYHNVINPLIYFCFSSDIHPVSLFIHLLHCIHEGFTVLS